MILEEITVKDWRGYRGPHIFHFKDGINLVIGRNEAGKSTLFEALTRALFDRHTSKAEEIRAMQPLCSSLGPEVIILFRTGGIHFKVVKRFLQDPLSKLYSERNGLWELNCEGDASDNRLREILSGEGTSRTVARPEHRGLAQALWYLQSDGSIPEKEWNSGVKQGLQGLVEIAARSPKERAILERLDEVYDEYWTPTGRIATNSELGRLLAEMLTVEESVSILRERARTVESYRGDLEEFQDQEKMKKFELQQAEEELSGLDERVRAGESLVREKETKMRVRTEADEKARSLKKEFTAIQDRQEKNAETRQEIQKLEANLSDVADEVREQSEGSERHGRRWKEELEPALKGIEGELRALRASSHLLELQKDRLRLENHLDRVSKVHGQLDDAMRKRAALVAPDAKERKRFAKIEGGLSVLDARIEASAVRVAFEWKGKDRKVTTLPQLAPANEGEFIVTEPTEFLVQGMGKIRVRSGAQSLADLVGEKDRAQLKRKEILHQYGAEDAEDLATLQEKARELDRIVNQLEEILKATENSESNAEGELARVKIDIDQETSSAEQLALYLPELGEISIEEITPAKEKEKRQLIKDIDREQGLEKEARQRHMDLLKTRETKSAKLADLRAQVRTHEETIATTLENYGTLDYLKKSVADSKEDLEKIDISLGKLMEGYEERVETPLRLQEQVRARAKELDENLGELRTKLVETMARIEEAAAQGNYSQLADTEIELERRKRRAATLQIRANGVMLLNNLVQACEKDRTAKLSGPVETLVNRWLKLLTEGNYESLRMDETLRPVGVHVSGYSTELPMTSLSHGAQEQVVVLLRLGIGVLVSKDERNLIVIDDRLVNADPVRMKRLCLILQEAAQTCQLIIASCNDTPYLGIGAQLIRVPTDGVASE